MTLDPDIASQLDILDDEALTPSDPLGSRNVLKPEAAEVADLWLRRLARREIMGRVVLGRIAEIFLARGAQHALGFARAGDYARERLGLSASQLYEVARVARELRSLPQVAAALDRGELGWTKARELAGTATSETEQEWLALARAYTADGLKLAVKRFKRRPSGADQSGADARSLKEVAREAVRAAVAAASTTATADDDSSASNPADLAMVLDDDEIDDEPTATFRVRCPRRIRRLWSRTRELACRVAGSELADWQAAEAIAAENLSAGDCSRGDEHPAGQSPAPDFTTRIGQPRAVRERFFIEPPTDAPPIAADDDFEAIDSIRWLIDASLIDDRIPDTLERLADGAAQASPHELDRRMRLLLAAMARVDWQLGRLLRMTFALRLHMELGYLTEGSYVRNRLGMCSRKARALVALDRRSWQSSLVLTDAYREGRLSWYRCLMLMPILSEENADAWIERASSVTVRVLKDQLEWALEIKGNSPLRLSPMPPAPGEALDRRPCQSCGREHTDAELDPERQIRGHATDECIACCHADEALADVEVRIRGPVSVISLLYELVTASKKAAEPPWRGLERMLRHAETEWTSLPKHRDPVFARDGWRCTTPACTSRRHLEDHHIVFRSQGGDNDRSNRTTVCVWHHNHGIHLGRVRVHGTAAGGLIWELGVRRDGPPLMKLRGDVYLKESEEGLSRAHGV